MYSHVTTTNNFLFCNISEWLWFFYRFSQTEPQFQGICMCWWNCRVEYVGCTSKIRLDPLWLWRNPNFLHFSRYPLFKESQVHLIFFSLHQHLFWSRWENYLWLQNWHHHPETCWCTIKLWVCFSSEGAGKLASADRKMNRCTFKPGNLAYHLFKNNCIHF